MYLGRCCTSAPAALGHSAAAAPHITPLQASPELPQPIRRVPHRACGLAEMLLLFESAAGFALFKVLKEGKLKEADTEVRAADAYR